MNAEHLYMPSEPHVERPWHSLSFEAATDALASPENGLSVTEADARLQVYGRNEPATARSRSALLRFVGQFHNLLLYLMMGAGLVTAFLGEWVDAGVLWAAVVVNVVIGFVQEGKAENALSAIRGMLAPHATVIRNGQRQIIEAACLVP